jgi:small-conductance mechanosensitive channel
MERELSLAWFTTKSIMDATCSHLPNIIIGIIVYFVFVKLSGTLRKIIMRIAEHAKLDITLSQALGSLSSAGLILLGLLVTAAIVVPGFKPSHIIAGLGVTSVAVGFASKDIVENFFAGLLLLWQKPFRLGDFIKTGDFEGTVEEMRIKSTRLRTADGELVIIPNGIISSNPIVIKKAYQFTP